MNPAETVDDSRQKKRDNPSSLDGIFRALCFAAYKHRDQRRKGECGSPYINHPIEVAEMLVRVGRITDPALLQAAILHDTIEDTETSAEELEAAFGPDVRQLVVEVTDNKALPKAERKQRQIVHAHKLSSAARELKIADKICNVRDVTNKPPKDWPLERRVEYLAWSERVVAGCRGVNARLEQAFDAALDEGQAMMRVPGRRTSQ